MIATSKKQWRANIRALHQGQDVRDQQSKALCQHILSTDWYQSAKVIGGYVPMAHEADIMPVLQSALRDGKQLALPLCGVAPRMTLRLVSDLSELTIGKYGILEPGDTLPVIPPQALDLMLVPLEAIDDQGYRLGKGGGYYDCLLRSSGHIITLGCALSWQRVQMLPRDEWDIPLYGCVDAGGIRCFSHNGSFMKGNT